MPRVSLSGQDAEDTSVYGRELQSSCPYCCPFCKKRYTTGAKAYWHRIWQSYVCPVCRWMRPKNQLQPVDEAAEAAMRKLLGFK